MKRILTIAGSDSGGGAGIQADLKTITLLGGFGMSVLTALTAQNTLGVTAIHAVPPAFIGQQLDAVLSDIGADAVKIGMLYDAAAIEMVADRLLTYGIEKVVVDPVMLAKGGDVLLVEQARETLARRLIPMAFVVTPNIPEAEVLSKRSISTEKDVHEAARVIHAMGARHVLIKGGHLKGPAKDFLYDGKAFFEFSKDRIHTPHTHGTGCVYSAAIATYLAMALEVKVAVEKAKAFIHTAIRFALPLGQGHGPTNLFAQFAREQEKYRVLEALKTSLTRLMQVPIGHLVPEVQSNLGYALPFAETHADVAAFPGRLVRIGENIEAVSGPAFGASQHIASIILTAMRHDPGFRSAMNIRFSEAHIQQCQALGWKVCSFDRAHEPKATKEVEGSSLEWGTEKVLSQEATVPDMIFDRGDVGKEPMIRVLGRNPDEVVDKVLRLQKP
ncbi:MAG: bifunctional hydroxymethylpyrimidine kinase/phosphomethylpyrimidine kinase [Deltaproteobacteria bacterium]|nr:bifunctional hydroxymethylpyrimidine kinase/phosphomethylpyrimidine kinase [Deltaproteobacteria bacterium]MBW2074910.1 bifunctional hydroxymethylpyrimidine kinase/phosphomethylpyrimidine kinase [Deltaproteobacteria bacterium]RLB81300.1 MAG: bifunctional hydroxymethylpyrimidine kinase/phosphomethylpyrimidine kinase [Deltaproteobacteria bacterium]